MSATEQTIEEAALAAGEAPEPDPEPEVENPDAEPAEGPIEADDTDSEYEEADPVAREERAQAEENRKKLERSATTWRNRVSDVLGEEAGYLVPCELCEPDIPGFHFPADLMQPYNELQAHLIDVLRAPEAPDYPAAADVGRCQVCDGWGSVTTGSRKAGQETKACANCLGFGYQPPPGSTAAGSGTGVAALALVNGEPAPMVRDDVDAWGSPLMLADGQENPNYGKMPQYKNPALP